MNELAPRPSLPCQPIPYGLVSLWEIMIGIEAASFATILHDIEKMRAATNSISLDKDACRSLVREAAALRIDLLKLGLTTSSIKCARFAAVVPDSGIAGSDFSNALKVLTETIEDELQGKYVFFLTSERSKYYPTKVNHIFGDLVEKAMDSEMLQDVSEAGKCLAFARDTAAVFHLMRLFERALTSIGQKLNVKNPKPGWDDYITALDEEVAKPWKDRTIKGKHQEVSEVTAHLRAVKNAWRNPTMHVSGTYDFDRASAIFDATKGLMKAIVTSGVFELVGSDPKAS